MAAGYIYLLTNLLNDKCYVGQTMKRPVERWHEHVVWSKRLRVYLAHAIQKYGAENFTLTVLAQMEGDDEEAIKTALDALEKLWIICLRSCESAFGYNMTYGGEGGSPTDAVRARIGTANRGRKWTLEQRAKIMKTRSLRPHPNRGMKMSPERLALMNNARLSKPVSAETRAKLSAAGKRQKQSVKTRRKRSEAFRGPKNPMYGTRWKVQPDGRRLRIA